MKIERECKIEVACSKDFTRGSLMALHLEGKEIVACDGSMLVVVPVERDDADVDGYVTVEALVAARKAGKRGPVPLLLNGEQRIPSGPTYPRPKEDEIGAFPDWRQVVPRFKAEPKGPMAEIYRAAMEELKGRAGRHRVARKGPLSRRMRHLPACIRGWIADRRGGEGARIGVNLDFLARAGKAMGTAYACLQIPADPQSPIMVKPIKGNAPPAPDAYAVIMPMRLD